MIARTPVTLFVYALCEPGDEFCPRYVGISKDVGARLAKHKSPTGLPQVYEWMQSVEFRPRVHILETTVQPRCFFGRDVESWWIHHLTEQGHSLLNRTNPAADMRRYRAERFGKQCAKALRRACYQLKAGRPASMHFQVDASGFPVPGKHWQAPS